MCTEEMIVRGDDSIKVGELVEVIDGSQRECVLM